MAKMIEEGFFADDCVKFMSRMNEKSIDWTDPKDLVFDPMCGSGTTGKMALKHNRRFIGVDISEEYIAIAKERVYGTRPRSQNGKRSRMDMR